MIYTVTLNPAIDYVMRAGRFAEGNINRADGEEIFFGGKGINVSLVLRELGVLSTALGFIAGFTGDALEEGVQKAGIATDFVRLGSGFTRINVKIRSGSETDVNGRGPEVDADSLGKLLDKLGGLKTGDCLVLSGSIPATLPGDVYTRILDELSGRGITFYVDASKELLLSTLKYGPFLVKPNVDELGETFGVKLESKSEIIRYAQRLRELGARSVLVSMAGEGSLYVDENGRTHNTPACRGKLVNSVGAGDSMLAGFIAGMQTGDTDYALRLGTACGGATAFSEGLCRKEKVFELLRQLGE